MKTKFTTTEVIMALGLKREGLRAWEKLGFVSPTLPPGGHGRTALYSRMDILRIALFRSLLQAGISRSFAGNFIKEFSNTPEETADQTDFFLFRMNGDQVLILGLTRNSIIDAKTGSHINLETRRPVMTHEWNHPEWKIPYDHLHVVNFGKIRGSVDEALRKLE